MWIIMLKNHVVIHKKSSYSHSLLTIVKAIKLPRI